MGNSRGYAARATAALIVCLAAASPCLAEQPPVNSYPFEDTFTFGLWGTDFAPYNAGLEGLMRDMRRACMNCLIDAPRITDPFEAGDGEETGPQRIARLQKELKVCGGYGVGCIPYVGVDFRTEAVKVENVREVAAALSGERNLWAWDIQGEPDPAFLPTFEKYKAAIQAVAPKQPALCLFYRPDVVEAFAQHQPLLVTDCYPVAIMHEGTSLGPHFAVREGPLQVTRNMDRYNMWGVQGVLEWMDLCRALTGGLPHWVTLQVFESGNSHLVRWRQPTVSELRLQTYLALAGGAKGIQYFRYALLVDSYGNPLPSLHGEHSPLWEQVKRLGAAITPLGPLFVDWQVSDPVTTVTAFRPTKNPGDGIETRRLRSKTRDVDYVMAWNNDTLVRHAASVNLTRDFVGNRKVYDLFKLRPVEAEAYPGALACPVDLEPGDATILSVASDADWSWQRNTALKGRCENGSSLLGIDYELARKSGCDLDQAGRLQQECKNLVAEGKYEDALAHMKLCGKAVAEAIEMKPSVDAVQQDLDAAKGLLGRLEREGKLADASVSKTYSALLRRFWNGEAEAIQVEVKSLRQTLEQATQGS